MNKIEITKEVKLYLEFNDKFCGIFLDKKQDNRFIVVKSSEENENYIKTIANTIKEISEVKFDNNNPMDYTEILEVNKLLELKSFDSDDFYLYRLIKKYNGYIITYPFELSILAKKDKTYSKFSFGIWIDGKLKNICKETSSKENLGAIKSKVMLIKNIIDKLNS